MVVDPASAPVCLKYKAYKRMVGYAIRYANNHLEQKKWKEVYGILVGSVEKETKVIVKDAIPMIVGDRAGVKYENKTYVDMAQIDASVYERSIQDKKNDFIIGWWHTHPGFAFFFSDVDKITHLGYQSPNPFGVALIFDHCEKNQESLGVAALRLKKPERGIFSTHQLVKLDYDLELEEINQKIEKAIEKIDKNMRKILKELKYIQDVLIEKGFKLLQKNYGLSLIPKKDITALDENELETEDIDDSYVWDPEYFKKSYQIPKFREKIEIEIKNCQEILKKLLKEEDTAKFKANKSKFKKKLKNMLIKPNELYNKITNEFIKKIDIISPYYDYLDTDERLIVEKYEENMNKYHSILTKINKKAELNLKAK